jgi:HAD superfamily hydrolase (TIGR01662 family)
VTIRAVVFDVGETLVDETDAWGDWADWLGIPRLTLFGVLGAVIARSGDHREVFEILRPGLDIGAEIRARQAAGRRPMVMVDDLYPDALDCLRRLAAAGYRLGIAGNQPTSTEAVLGAIGVPLEIAASSEGWGVHKPDPAFFERIVAELHLAAGEVAYVGDRLDNDVGPAARAGMAAIFVRRGPWAFIQTSDGREVAATATIDSLAELPAVLDRLG